MYSHSTRSAFSSVRSTSIRMCINMLLRIQFYSITTHIFFYCCNSKFSWLRWYTVYSNKMKMSKPEKLWIVFAWTKMHSFLLWNNSQVFDCKKRKVLPIPVFVYIYLWKTYYFQVFFYYYFCSLIDATSKIAVEEKFTLIEFNLDDY